MNLCLDIGNTRVKMAVFNDNELLVLNRTEDLDFDVIHDWKDKYGFKKGILSTTRNISLEERSKLEKYAEIFELTHETKVPIINNYETPTTLGKDRLAAAVASAKLFPGEHVVFIDCGTCLTYNFIDKNGIFEGGNIAPGVSMRLQAMKYFTDKLPEVEKQYNEGLFGKNTVKAMQNGAVKGAMYEITSFIEGVFKQYGETKIILTGGDSLLFAKHLNFKIFALPNLVLYGLNQILMHTEVK